MPIDPQDIADMMDEFPDRDEFGRTIQFDLAQFEQRAFPGQSHGPGPSSRDYYDKLARHVGVIIANELEYMEIPPYRWPDLDDNLRLIKRAAKGRAASILAGGTEITFEFGDDILTVTIDD